MNTPTPTAWRLIYQHPISAEPELETPLAEALISESQRLGLPTEFVQKVTTSMQNAVQGARALGQASGMEFQSQLFVYVSEKLPTDQSKPNWGFFKIEKAEPASSAKRKPIRHTIEFYLYSDG